jgi:hypothetical protein
MLLDIAKLPTAVACVSRLRFLAFLGRGIMAETYADPTLQEHASAENLESRLPLT